MHWYELILLRVIFCCTFSAKAKKSDSLGDLTLKPTETQAEVENTLDKKKVAAEPEEKLDDLTSAPCDDDTLMYRLSNPVCMNLGWTVKLEETSALLLDGNQRGLEDSCKVIDTTAQRNALNIEDTTSSQRLTNGMIGHAELGNIEQRYSDGSLFITSFTDKSGTVFYPNGAPAMVLLPAGEGDARTSGLLCLVHEVVHRTGKKSDKRKDADRENVKNAEKINKMTAGRMLAVLSTLGYGTIYDSDGRIRFQYNSTGGMQFAEKAVGQACNVTKRRWNWSGDPHMHAPPFQSVTIRINRNIHFVATRKERIYLHFQHGDRRCRIDVSMSQ
ncbi:unnamed protein product [Dicrocoelium dendriticum]|nr:unnamed protein product [Dicrocoelium dendriticum]